MTRVRMIIATLIALAAVLALWWLYAAVTASPKAAARLGKNQTGAALESGADAVGAVGRQQAGEATIDATTRENDRAIRTAPGADAPVDPALRDTALRGLCKRRAYSGNAKCLQYATPR